MGRPFSRADASKHETTRLTRRTNELVRNSFRAFAHPGTEEKEKPAQKPTHLLVFVKFAIEVVLDEWCDGLNEDSFDLWIG